MQIPPLALLLLAAGKSTRMGDTDKLLLPVAGKTLLERTAEIAMASGHPLYVTLSPERPARATVLRGMALKTVVVADAAEGIGASLRGGVAAIPEDHAILVMLADLPDLSTADLERVIAQWQLQPHRIHRGGNGIAKPGHPVIFPPALRPALLALKGDQGAKEVISQAEESPIIVLLPANNALRDIDTPEDWARWQQSQS